jgi:leucyl/phenylalanyl-tRNA--protein transferase
MFPDPSQADEEGLLALGGDLGAERLLNAYENGIFPWYDQGLPPLWWSPDPRAVLDPQHLHISRSTRRVLRTAGFEVSCNRDFVRVMKACGRQRREGTWILPEMVDAYFRLHELGHAMSFEVWHTGTLVGGLYGVQRGGFFAAESMFHRRPNASKVALIVSVCTLFDAGLRLYDVQFLTPHLQSLGAYEISRAEYLTRLKEAVAVPLQGREPVGATGLTL